MPGFDGTGPGGLGPMTGGGRGFCAVQVSSLRRPAGGSFFGRDRGRRNRYWAAGAYPYAPGIMPTEEINILKDQAEVLKQQLADINSYLSALEKVQKQEKGE